jgi:2-oxoisovalerate dehydrogenase E2 component (dihydrolipoyl transacylase)
MGLFTFRLPDIGEGIAEAEIVAWHVKVGDRVEEDGKLADLMTDKATVEMESPVAGVVREVAGEVGDVIAIGSALAVIETEGEDVEASETDAPVASETATEPMPRLNPSPVPGEGDSPQASGVREVESGDQAPVPSPSQPSAGPLPLPERERDKEILASPAVRARAGPRH